MLLPDVLQLANEVNRVLPKEGQVSSASSEV